MSLIRVIVRPKTGSCGHTVWWEQCQSSWHSPTANNLQLASHLLLPFIAEVYESEPEYSNTCVSAEHKVKKLKSEANNQKNGSQQSAPKCLEFIREIKNAAAYTTTTRIPWQSCWIPSILSKPDSAPGPLCPRAISRAICGRHAAYNFCDRRSTGQSRARLPVLFHLYHAVLLLTSGLRCTGFLLFCKY